MVLSSAYFPSPHFWDALYKFFNKSENGTATDALQEIIRLDFPKKKKGVVLKLCYEEKGDGKFYHVSGPNSKHFVYINTIAKIIWYASARKGGWGALPPIIYSEGGLHPKGVHSCKSLCELRLRRKLNLHWKPILPFNIQL